MLLEQALNIKSSNNLVIVALATLQTITGRHEVEGELGISNAAFGTKEIPLYTCIIVILMSTPRAWCTHSKRDPSIISFQTYVFKLGQIYTF